MEQSPDVAATVVSTAFHPLRGKMSRLNNLPLPHITHMNHVQHSSNVLSQVEEYGGNKSNKAQANKDSGTGSISAHLGKLDASIKGVLGVREEV